MVQGELASGDLFSFVIYSVFVGGNIGGLASVFTKIQKFIGATEDLFAILEEKEEDITTADSLKESEKLHGAIQFKDLTFSYPSRPDDTVLSNINIKVETNEMVALVGASGAGKSTIASLLLMLHSPEKNQLFFDGNECHSIPLSALRSQIGLVPQDIFLFGGTIGENIAYGNPSASEEEWNDKCSGRKSKCFRIY